MQTCGGPLTSDIVLLGHSAAVERLRAQLRRVAPHFRTALLTGERGTGKAAVARALHALSPLAARRMTTAHDENGIEAARGGTLFLPELGELNAAEQNAVLGALERGVRVIAATEHSLKTLAATGRLQPNLRAAMSTVEITVPAVRQRVEDIPELAETMLKGKQLTLEFLHALEEYAWPGNLREMQETLAEAERTNGERMENLPKALLRPRIEAATPGLAKLQEVIDQHVFAVLSACAGNKLRTAEVLGISRSTLYRMLEMNPLASPLPQ